MSNAIENPVADRLGNLGRHRIGGSGAILPAAFTDAVRSLLAATAYDDQTLI